MSAPVRLIPLGTNGFYPSHGRQTMSFLVLANGGALLLDAGSGVCRLGEERIAALLEPVDRLEIVLSHYHLDHVIGLSYLPGVWRGRPARIWAPAPPLVDGSAEGLRRLLAPPLFPVPLADFPLPVEVVFYDAGGFSVCGLEIGARRQRHPGGSVGLRLGDALAYITDTEIDEATVDFACGTRVLLHEVWLTEAELAAGAPGGAGHSTPEGVADLAARIGAGRLLPVHHHPKRSAAELAGLAAAIARRSGLEVLTGTEGVALEI